MFFTLGRVRFLIFLYENSDAQFQCRHFLKRHYLTQVQRFYCLSAVEVKITRSFPDDVAAAICFKSHVTLIFLATCVLVLLDHATAPCSCLDVYSPADEMPNTQSPDDRRGMQHNKYSNNIAIL
jgi:hypothetical protein